MNAQDQHGVAADTAARQADVTEQPDEWDTLTPEAAAELLEQTRTDFTPIRLPNSIARSITTRAGEESAFPAPDGKRLHITIGEIVTHAWVEYLERHPEARGEVVAWVQDARQRYHRLHSIVKSADPA